MLSLQRVVVRRLSEHVIEYTNRETLLYIWRDHLNYANEASTELSTLHLIEPEPDTLLGRVRDAFKKWECSHLGSDPRSGVFLILRFSK